MDRTHFSKARLSTPSVSIAWVRSDLEHATRSWNLLQFGKSTLDPETSTQKSTVAFASSIQHPPNISESDGFAEQAAEIP